MGRNLPPPLHVTLIEKLLIGALILAASAYLWSTYG